MPAINFSDQFVRKILAGEKRQTIRRERKRPIALYDKLTFYNRQRTKECWLVGKAMCAGLREIRVWKECMFEDQGMKIWETQCALGGKILNSYEKYMLAENDGFKGWDCLAGFLERYPFPFRGVLIEWADLTYTGSLPDWWDEDEEWEG